MNCSDGSAAGSSTTALTSSATSARSTCPPTRSAGSTTAASSSAGDIAGDRHRRLVDRRPEPLEGERSVVEVGAQGGHHPEAAVGRRDGVHQAVEERPLIPLGGEREQLLELVDDQQQLAAVGHEAADHAIDAAVPVGELVGEAGRLADGDVPQALGQLLERRRARQHRRDEPVPETRERHRGAPAAAARPARRWTCRSPTRRRPGPAAPAGRRRQPGEDLVDEVGATEEVGGVGLVERPQPLVRVGGASVDSGFRAGEGGDEHRHELAPSRPADRRHARPPGRRATGPSSLRPGSAPRSTAKSCTSSPRVGSGSDGPSTKSARYGSPGRRTARSPGSTRPCTIPCSAAATSAPPMRLTTVAAAAFVSGPRSKRSASVPP